MIIILLGILSDDEKDIISEIFEEYHLKLYNISYQILHSEQDAEDALAQTFLKIMDNIIRIKKIPRHEMLPFCVIILKNASVDIQRRNGKTVAIEYIDDIPEYSDDTEEIFFKNHERDQLLKLIRRLSSEDRYLLELRLGECMSYKEIGDLMDITEITARKRLQRALEKLQKLNLEEGYLNA